MSERVLLTLWVGGLWVVGYLVTPVLFATLDDRQLAGNLAGQLFQLMSTMGLIIGSLLLISTLLNTAVDWKRCWRVWTLLVMLLLVIVGAYVLQPMMQELKLQGLVSGSEQAGRFGVLHGISSVLYLGTSLLGLCLVATGMRADDSARA